MSENKFVAAIDQGTPSTRCIIFNRLPIGPMRRIISI